MSRSSSIGIRALARETGLSPHALRYYESAGLMLEVPRDARGHRAYTEEHVRWVRFLTRLRDSGMGIVQIREYTALTRGAGDEDGSRRREILRRHRDEVRRRLARLEEHLAILDRKIPDGCGPDESEATDTRGGTE